MNCTQDTEWLGWSEVSCVAMTTICSLVIFELLSMLLMYKSFYDKFKLWTSLYFSGDHKVNVYYSGTLVQGCPYTVRVWDASRVIVSNMPTSSVYGQPVVFDSKLKVCWVIIIASRLITSYFIIFRDLSLSVFYLW